ncbi:MAG: hypothetical protein WA477_08410, partial [Candidatus Sulfotelmatobacter sp.]
MPKRYATFLTALLLLWSVAVPAKAAVPSEAGSERGPALSAESPSPDSAQEQAQSPAANAASAYQGKTVRSIELPGVAERDRDHLLQLIAQKAATPLDRDQVRDSIRTLYSTGRFADIQAEVAPSGDDVVLTFATSPNFFVGAVEVEGAPTRPNA